MAPVEQLPQNAVPGRNLLEHIKEDLLNFTFYLLLVYTLGLYYVMIVDVLGAMPWVTAHLPVKLPAVKGISSGTADFYFALIAGYAGVKELKRWRKASRLKELSDPNDSSFGQQARWLTAGAFLANGWLVIAMAATFTEAMGHMTKLPDQLIPLAYKSFFLFLASKTSGYECAANLKQHARKTRRAEEAACEEAEQSCPEESAADAQRVSEAHRQQVLEYLKLNKSINHAACMELTRLKDHQVTRLLNGMKSSQRLRSSGFGKSMVYVLNEGQTPESVG
jgi:hypothetical protein